MQGLATRGAGGGERIEGKVFFGGWGRGGDGGGGGGGGGWGGDEIDEVLFS